MIDVYYWPTPNGWKVTIMLEECGLDYIVVPVDIGGGDQFKPEFLAISPNNRMPAIVDSDPMGGGEPVTIFESGAILEYLAEKTGKFLPSEPRDRFKVLQWVHWQMANLGPMMGNANHFKNYGKNLASDPKQLEYGIKRFVGEVDRLAGVMDAQLSVNEYLAGAEYSIADIISWTDNCASMTPARRSTSPTTECPQLSIPIPWVAVNRSRFSNPAPSSSISPKRQESSCHQNHVTGSKYSSGYTGRWPISVR